MVASTNMIEKLQISEGMYLEVPKVGTDWYRIEYNKISIVTVIAVRAYDDVYKNKLEIPVKVYIEHKFQTHTFAPRGFEQEPDMYMWPKLRGLHSLGVFLADYKPSSLEIENMALLQQSMGPNETDL